ncbi:Phospho-2-dehydro-3-deoxyheptonate aldolase 2 chloroplastic [Bienertia sinuspersici]
MTLTTSTSTLTLKPLLHDSSQFNSPKPHQPTLTFTPIRASSSSSSSPSTTTSTTRTRNGQSTVGNQRRPFNNPNTRTRLSWIRFSRPLNRESRSLEERIGQASMGNAFLLQGGDCAESFKEFSANNIRDTFRVLLQMSVLLMFGGQMPIVKV